MFLNLKYLNRINACFILVVQTITSPRLFILGFHLYYSLSDGILIIIVRNPFIIDTNLDIVVRHTVTKKS